MRSGIARGKDIVFTDSNGYFSIAEKHKANPIRLDTDNFMLPGKFELVSAPAVVTDGTPAVIVVRRL
jgi:hypothetical protein